MKHNLISKKLQALLAFSLVISMLLVPGCKKKDTSGQGTPESTVAPAKSVDEIFAKGDKDYYVPFQNPDHSYCTINDGYGTPVREQGTGGCFAYAAVSSMQSNYLKKHGELIDLNPIDLLNRIYTVVEDVENADPKTFTEEKYYVSGAAAGDLGGDVTRVAGVLCADPLNGYLLVESNQIIDPTLDEIKEWIREYGACTIVVNYKKASKEIHGYRTQNYSGTDTDHVATIVGWDDDFPADCFLTPASQNGAWLVQNSFGTLYGNCGYYWISYDQKIEFMQNCEVSNEYSSAITYGRFPVTSVCAPEGIEKIKAGAASEDFTDEEICSWGDASVASVYSKKGDIAAIGFWTTLLGQTYTIEIRDGEFGEVLSTKSGSFDTLGYHTVELDAPVSVKKFTVVLTMSGLVSCEGISNERTVSTFAGRVPCHYEAKTEKGHSYFMFNGEWVDITDPDFFDMLGLRGVEGVTDECGDPCITVLFK
ncbi:MAG: hypothetical protein J6Y08_01415 [Clostridiales bacterium]|nr:hypothetical protein [Clostridiales bacterium]